LPEMAHDEKQPQTCTKVALVRNLRVVVCSHNYFRGLR
jgi:hypothetical protein